MVPSANASPPPQETRAAAQAMMPAAPEPPPLCPSLILPNAEALFKVPMTKLVQGGESEFDIIGTSGRALLHAVVSFQGGKRTLSVSSVGSSLQEPRCVVTLVPGWGGGMLGGSQTMKIHGRDSELYGTLTGQSNGAGRLSFDGPPLNGAEVIQFEVGSAENFEMSASTMDGRALGSGSSSGSEWKLQVKKKVDAVLVCSCMLALSLLAARPGTASGRSSVVTAGTAQ